jgi:hypothetical protein
MKKGFVSLLLLLLPLLTKAQTISPALIGAGGSQSISLSPQKIKLSFSIGEAILPPNGVCGTSDPILTFGFQQPDTFVTCTDTVSAIREAIKDNSYISIYPNPSSGLFHLKLALQDNEPALIKVYDISGRDVWQSRSNYATDIDLSGHSAGMYFVHVLYKDIESVKKICLQ